MVGAGPIRVRFPEGLANSPASHVALLHGLRGPNITVGSKGIAGESAMIQAASLLRHGQADLAIVLAGDTLTRAVYEWYEVAGRLSRACFNAETVADGGFMPSEGVAALVMERSARRDARVYARFQAGCRAASGDAEGTIRKMLEGVVPNFILCAGSGAGCGDDSTEGLARAIAGSSGEVVAPHEVAAGLARFERAARVSPGLERCAGQGSGAVIGNIGRSRFFRAAVGDRLNMSLVNSNSLNANLLNANVRIAAAAYAVPPQSEDVSAVMERERERVQATLAPLSERVRQKAAEGLGLSRVRVCGHKQPYDLVREAASAAIAEAGVAANDINLILDYSTFPGENSEYLSIAQAQCGTGR